MAARLNPKHQQSVRDKIQAGEICRQIQLCVDGEREMDPQQLRAAIFLVEQSIGKAPQSIEAQMDGELIIRVINYGSNTDFVPDGTDDPK